MQKTDDLRILEIKELVQPAAVLREFPLSDKAAEVTFNARQAIHRILHGADDRLVVIAGPCSIHDVKAAREYATKLKAECERLTDDLLILMRVYFEKPRTTVGWKGLIPNSMAASISTKAYALRANCSSASTNSACRQAANFST
jgi:3-deoxy-7-phosphoheptulonate synthase